MGAKASGLIELEQDLQAAAEQAAEETAKVVKKAAQNIKTDVRARWAGMRHAPYLPAAVSYDEPAVEGNLVRTEVGPDKSKPQGALGNLLEYGSVHNAPRPALAPAADAEEPRFTQALEDLGRQLLDGGGRD